VSSQRLQKREHDGISASALEISFPQLATTLSPSEDQPNSCLTSAANEDEV